MPRKKKPEPEPEKPKGHKPDEMRHIERYTFPLLTHLMGLLSLEEAVAEKYLGWLEKDLSQGDSRAILGRLCNAGSDNHLYLLMACALWRDGSQGPWVQAWTDLFDFQSHGSCPWGEGFEELAFWGHAETHSTTYEGMRWEAALTVKAWTRKWLAAPVFKPVDDIYSRVVTLAQSADRYLQAMAAFWSIGSEWPWEELEGRSNARGELYDDSLLVPACGERSTMAHAFQSDLGSLLCHATNYPNKSKRLSPAAAAIIGAVPAGYYVKGGFLSKEAAEVLRDLGVRTNREIVYELWGGGERVMYCTGPRLNGNTPDVKFYYLSIQDHRIEIGFPWEGGRGEATAGIGGDCIRSVNGLVATGNVSEPVLCALPPSPPLLKITINKSGVTIE